MREEVGGYVYILASGRVGTLYTGSTRDLARRVYEHREGLLPGFTRKYGVTRLVWFEAHDSIAAAYRRECSIKRWRRAWKIALIEADNLQWDDLYPSIAGSAVRWPDALRGAATRFPDAGPDLIRAASRDPAQSGD
ncbi:GIY-YIG nuclease family protein [Terricaulis sp.]|uniref:GIY-YIG nuclease family protein n=1 Tax=Terricaulis sp. TaxID=2768686 RepID=UPI002AC76A0E|nr:GIY-YIG nuclease family protein [Terricaulis sp.]MDZ4690614.1 GIY-YIG nuclease family protein [Terricaulis sp.]